MSEQNIYYQVQSFDDDCWHTLAVKDNDYECNRWTAQACAQHFYDSNYGLEKEWPLVFTLKLSINAAESIDFMVAREIKPKTT